MSYHYQFFKQRNAPECKQNQRTNQHENNYKGKLEVTKDNVNKTSSEAITSWKRLRRFVFVLSKQFT